MPDGRWQQMTITTISLSTVYIRLYIQMESKSETERDRKKKEMRKTSGLSNGQHLFRRLTAKTGETRTGCSD